MHYRDLFSGNYYLLPGGPVVRAFRHAQCVELRELQPDGCGGTRRWLAHPEGRIRSTRGSGEEYDLAALEPCDPETEASLRASMDRSRNDLEEQALRGLAVVSQGAVTGDPQTGRTLTRWQDSPPPRPWGRSDLLDLLRLLQSLNEIAIRDNLSAWRPPIERAQEAGYDLWALL